MAFRGLQAATLDSVAHLVALEVGVVLGCCWPQQRQWQQSPPRRQLSRRGGLNLE